MLALCFGFNEHMVKSILKESVKIKNIGDRIGYISAQFKNTPYRANTLKGSPDAPERLVINLHEMDCFTFLDYVEALRLSFSKESFPQNLKKVRYFDGEVSYTKRRHFFTDWAQGESASVKDVTPELPGSVMVEKYINRKSDDKNWLKNVPHTLRMVTYVPAEKIDKKTVEMLQNGDYLGIFTDKKGLDVTHTGIFIRNKNGEFFRNTSSILMKVTDYPFNQYLKKIKGIIVLRPR